MDKPKISACVITFNEEHNIRRCLQSVAWCDEIVVLDSYSTDGTLDICREFTDKVFQQPWKGYIGQRNAIRELAAGEWLLFLDADEEISPKLRCEIQEFFATGAKKYVGLRFSRQVFYLGRWIKWGEWNPDIKMRLFLREHGRSAGQEPHDQVIVDGPAKTLKGKLWHYTYEDIAHHLNTMNRFSGISARSMYEAGRKFSFSDIFLRPPFRFFKAYFLKLGILDGRRGFIIAAISALGVAMKYAKLWEIELAPQSRPESGGNPPAGEAKT